MNIRSFSVVYNTRFNIATDVPLVIALLYRHLLNIKAQNNIFEISTKKIGILEKCVQMDLLKTTANYFLMEIKKFVCVIYSQL